MIESVFRIASKGLPGAYVRPVAAVAVLAAMAVAFAPAAVAQDLKPSGTVQIEQVQIAFIGSGNLGGGTLNFQGNTYSFTIGGLGIGGYGISKIEASGTVYNLSKVSDFAGGYVQARYGMAAGDVSTGSLWLQSAKGVVMSLDAKRTGLALSLGGDVIYIDLD